MAVGGWAVCDSGAAKRYSFILPKCIIHLLGDRVGKLGCYIVVVYPEGLSDLKKEARVKRNGEQQEIDAAAGI
jgi:hypothetical protein